MVTVAGARKLAKEDRWSSPKLLWLLAAVTVAIVTTLVLATPNNPDVVAGFTTHELVLIDSILFLSGMMSGLSGFGFSAVGAATLLFMPPITEAR